LVAGPEELASSKPVLELRDDPEGRVRRRAAAGAAQPELKNEARRCGAVALTITIDRA